VKIRYANASGRTSSERKQRSGSSSQENPGWDCGLWGGDPDHALAQPELPGAPLRSYRALRYHCRVLETLGKQWNISHVTTDYQELVNRHDVDAILVASPNAFHATAVLDAIAAGEHVLVEKPMCLTFREAQEILDARKSRKIVVQIGYMRRYAPAFLDACQAVKHLPRIKYARVRDFIGANSLIVKPTSRVVRDEELNKSLKKKDARAREISLLTEDLGGKPAEPLKQAYTLLVGLSSYDLSAMREMLGSPRKVLFAAQRAGGSYVTAAFDYGSFICQFETSLPRQRGVASR
jgi:Oxidoreductase family, NAD-binding Rossmann fold